VVSCFLCACRCVQQLSGGNFATYTRSRETGLFDRSYQEQIVTQLTDETIQRRTCGTEGGLKAYFWWIESVLAIATDHTSSNIISRDISISISTTYKGTNLTGKLNPSRPSTPIARSTCIRSPHPRFTRLSP
jgi:hypothetical protein